MAVKSKSATYAQTLVDWLNDKTNRSWPLLGWTARRCWEAVENLVEGTEATDVPIVQVAAITRQPIAATTREILSQGYEFEIYVRQKYTPATPIDDAWIDARVELLESMENQLWDFDGVATLPSGVALLRVMPEGGVQMDTVCDQFDLNENRQYTGILAVTLMELRDR